MAQYYKTKRSTAKCRRVAEQQKQIDLPSKRMRELSRYTNQDRVSLIKTDGGSYLVEMYISEKLVETKEFNEHGFRIVENFAKEWISNQE